MNKIFLEPLDRDLILEVEHIILQNYSETSHFHEPLDIDWDVYMMYGDAFKAFTMRDENLHIVGILFFIVAQYPHIKSLAMAQQTTFYVVPEHRGQSLRLLKHSEDYFKKHNIDIIVQSARYDSSFCNVLDAKGYQRADITYTKRLS